MNRNSDGGDLRVTLLGALVVRRGDAVVPLPGARIRGLLVRLAVAGGRPVTPAQLTDALWPEDRPADPANALQSLVSRLRRLLGAGDAVVQTEGGYRLAVDPIDVDVLRFEQLATTGRDRLRGGDPAGAAGALGEAAALLRDPLGEAAALLRGPLAPELAEVAPAQSTRLAAVIVAAGADLAEAEIALGHAERASTRLTALAADHPLDERLAALLIDALAAQGRQGDALAVYEGIRERLADELGADPGAALRDRHLLLLRGAPDVPKEESPGEAPGVTRSNLPAPLTSFIGRDDDLARVDALLSAGRLVTVLGPGGAGKTRLAMEAARRRGADYRDGAWLVDLASVTEAAKVGAAVVAAAGLRGSALFETANRARGERDDIDVLADRLNGREILLVVDNCEHLIDAVAHLTSALLVRCPQLRILATSREPLAVDGESLVPLGPLGMPPADAGPAQAARTPAVRLFAERAAAVRPGFAVDETTVRDVVQIVRGLDGLPLALELAAARLRTLALPELATGLSDRFRLLTTGNRTAQPRHRTLRAVIAWSWNLLSGDERALAERIAVLPGGVTASSAAAVFGGNAADLLAALVDRSLLQLAPDGGRYRMLETLREYGIERLTEQGVLTATRGRAAAYLAALIAEYDPMLRTRDQLTALRVINAEYDNILSGLRHFCDVGDARAAIRLALDLCWFWQMFGRDADAAYWLSAALAVPGARDEVEADCAEAVLMINRTGHEPAYLTETAAERRERLHALAQRLKRHELLPGPQGATASALLYFAGENDAADERINRMINGDDPWIAALSRMFRAQIAENNGDLVRLRADVADGLAGFTAAGDRWGQATVLPLRALLRQYEGDLDGALADLTQARALARQFGAMDLADEVFIDLRWADLHMRRGEQDEARAAVNSARARAERSASLEMMLLVDALEAGLLIVLGDLDRAETLLDRAATGLGVENLPVVGGDHGAAIIGSVRAGLALRRGDADTAERQLELAYTAAVETQDMPIMAMVAVTAGGLAELRGQHREAALLLGAAARLRGSHDHTDLHVAAISAKVRAALGDAGFGEAYAIGWGLESPAALTRVKPSRLSLGPASS
ncbi:SARP family transcriptional regulator [Actinoplanes sp. OR16]|uniref:AfsR/SARP family transcriptional regulator n=1 Tax=Actinoplanes sp. OR16 TaxID=946334 RepID=UPI000F6D9AAA|nr:BTAD domain-containing putative transcriptional regulator [Actinoplanes sp. OR16]BBH71647.1 SARP family transcriptional regulator [Actinoplanes sp. OR16]